MYNDFVFPSENWLATKIVNGTMELDMKFILLCISMA